VLAGPTQLNARRTQRRTPPTADEAAAAAQPPPSAAVAATLVVGAKKRGRVPPPPVPLFSGAPAATPARATRSAVAAVPFTPSGALVPVVSATPGASGRRVRCVVGSGAAAPTPGGVRAREPVAGETFFSANGSPLGSFVEGEGPSPAPAAPAEVEVDFAAMPESTLRGLQGLIGRLLGQGARRG
jgi:hypothetical protein